MAGNYDQGQALQEQVRLIDEIMLPYLAGGIKTCLRLMGFEGMNPRNPTRLMPADKIHRLEIAMRDVGLIQQ